MPRFVAEHCSSSGGMPCERAISNLRFHPGETSDEVNGCKVACEVEECHPCALALAPTSIVRVDELRTTVPNDATTPHHRPQILWPWPFRMDRWPVLCTWWVSRSGFLSFVQVVRFARLADQQHFHQTRLCCNCSSFACRSSVHKPLSSFSSVSTLFAVLEHLSSFPLLFLLESDVFRASFRISEFHGVLNLPT